jgi:hypothetical protein
MAQIFVLVILHRLKVLLLSPDVPQFSDNRLIDKGIEVSC